MRAASSSLPSDRAGVGAEALFEHGDPAVGVVVALLGAFAAETLPVLVRERDAAALCAQGFEAHGDVGRLRAAYIPLHREQRAGFERRHHAQVEFASILQRFIYAPADARLDGDAHGD